MLEKIENDYFVENMPKGYYARIAVWEDELLKMKLIRMYIPISCKGRSLLVVEIYCTDSVKHIDQKSFVARKTNNQNLTKSQREWCGSAHTLLLTAIIDCGDMINEA